MDAEPIHSATLSRLPVLALPSTVLFPGTVLPLQLDEGPQRELLESALEADGVVGVVMVRPGASDHDHAPELYDVGCAARIIHAEQQPSGRYQVLLQGLQRVHLREELPQVGPARFFRAELVPLPNQRAMARASRTFGRFESCVLSLRSSVVERDAQLCEVLRSTPDPVQLADVLAAAVISDTELQQRLLADSDVSTRLETLIDGLADVMVRSGEPPRTALRN